MTVIYQNKIYILIRQPTRQYLERERERDAIYNSNNRDSRFFLRSQNNSLYLISHFIFNIYSIFTIFVLHLLFHIYYLFYIQYFIFLYIISTFLYRYKRYLISSYLINYIFNNLFYINLLISR